jgi:Tfp pilus assembly protein PilV
MGRGTRAVDVRYLIARAVPGRRAVEGRSTGSRPYRAGFGGGFTLIEVLAALLFLAILVPAIASALTLSSRVSTLSDRRAVAVELAENQLNNELVGSGWESAAATNGDFGTGYPGYTWAMTQTSWSGDSVNTMTELDMAVTFPVQGRSQSVKLSTLVNSSVATQQGAALSGTSQNSTSTPATTAPATR